MEHGALDLDRFEALAADPTTLREALALWRGPALGGLGSVRLEREAAALQERRVAVAERAIALDLESGRLAGLVPELQALITEHPLRERLWELLMLALYNEGRQAEALETYQALARKLGEELGVDPDERLQRLHVAILNHEVAAPPAPRRNFLPRDLPDFTGRAHELARLANVDSSRAPAVIAIDGMAGVGKTALAVHLAHRLTPHYPDGQLFADLRAYTAGSRPADPSAVLEMLLHAMGVSNGGIAVDPAERAAQWRAELTGRRVLVVLDNVRDAAQVEQLLPGAPGCMVIITSRRRLIDLDAAIPLSLGVPGPDEAAELFSRVSGRATDDSVSTVVSVCGRLPLAVRLAAAQLRHRPAWTPAHLAKRLGDDERRLDLLAGHERSVTAVFELSVAGLAPGMRELFRALGLHPGVEFDAYAVAALAGTDPRRAELGLEELAAVNLLIESSPGRYRLHDLLREYAQQLSDAELAVEDRRAACERLMNYYAYAGEQAALKAGVLRPYPAATVFPTPPLDTVAQAGAWLDTERANVVAVTIQAASLGLAELAVRLGRTLSGQASAGRLDDVVTAHQAALRAATEAGDRSGMAAIHNALGIDESLRGNLPEVKAHFEAGLRLRRELGDRPREAGVLNNLGLLAIRLGDHEAAKDYLRQSLELHRQLDEPEKGVLVLSNLAHLARLDGDHAACLSYVDEALSLSGMLPPTEFAEALGNRAAAYVAMGRFEAALDDARRSLELLRERGGGINEAEALNIIANALRGLGDLAQAQEHHRRALESLLAGGGDPFVQGRIRLDLAATLAAAGRQGEADSERRQALALAVRNGLSHLESAAREALSSR